MKPTAPENFDGDAATDRLDLTWKAQVDLSRLNRPDSQVYSHIDPLFPMLQLITPHVLAEEMRNVAA